jgi:hypothetical protein
VGPRNQGPDRLCFSSPLNIQVWNQTQGLKVFVGAPTHGYLAEPYGQTFTLNGVARSGGVALETSKN